MPLYEFRCPSCGALFEALVDGGTQSTDCRACGDAGAERVLSQVAPPMHLVKPRGERRRQEQRNAELRGRAKERFKAARQRRRGRKDGGR